MATVATQSPEIGISSEKRLPVRPKIVETVAMYFMKIPHVGIVVVCIATSITTGKTPGPGKQAARPNAAANTKCRDRPSNENGSAIVYEVESPCSQLSRCNFCPWRPSPLIDNNAGFSYLRRPITYIISQTTMQITAITSTIWM